MADMCQSCGLHRNNHDAVYHPFVSLKINDHVLSEYKENMDIKDKGTEVCKICGIFKNDHGFLIHEYAK